MILIFICILLLQFVISDIPRACSTPETNQFDFCNPKLALDARINDLISQLKLEEKAPLLVARSSPYNISRLGIPEYNWGANCIHGVQSRCGTKCPTSFPNPNALGATFNRSVYQRLGEIIGLELRSLWLQGVTENQKDDRNPHIGLDCWSPNINLLRDPRWGRALETTGEDPYLNGEFGIYYTQGLQYNDIDDRFLQGVVTLKHYAAYSVEGDWNGTIRFNFDAEVNPYDWMDSYGYAFERSVTVGKARGVMCSYNAVNGVPMCANQDLFNTLRNTWGFDGYITSDSGAIKHIADSHNYTSTMVDAAKVALEAGCDIDSGHMPMYDYPNETVPYRDFIVDGVQNGTINESYVDQALYNSLKMRFLLGLFDPIDDQPFWHIPPEVVQTDAHVAASKDATRQAMTLLKNDKDILPLRRGLNIAVTGPISLAQHDLVGNYLGQICPEGMYNFDCVETPYDALKKANRGGNTTYTKSCSTVECKEDPSTFMGAIIAAELADVAVLFMGINVHNIEAESHDRKTLGFPGNQFQLIESILKVQPNTVVILNNGGPISLDTLFDKKYALLETYYAGVYAAEIIAETLFGDNNPSGKLPYTTYGSNYIEEQDMLNMDMTNGVGHTYKYYNGKYQEFPFGFGLSYSKFTLQNVKCPSKCIQADNSNTLVSVDVHNGGSMDGDEVVGLYLQPKSLKGANVTKALKIQRKLIDFERQHIFVGVSQTYTFELESSDFELVTDDGERKLMDGHYDLHFSTGPQNKLCSCTI